MSSVSLDASAAQILRSKLQTITGVDRVVVDDSTGAVLIHCEPDCSPALLKPRIDAAIAETDIDPNAISVNLVTDLVSRRRVKFVRLERFTESDNHVRIRVALEWNDEIHEGEAVGENGDVIELRTSAAAALDALQRVLGEDLHIKLVGVKQVRAFDAELIVVALYRGGGTPQRLVGSVSAGDDPRRAAAVAVLSALNRILGNYLIV